MITAPNLWRLSQEKPGAYLVVDQRLAPDNSVDPPRKARKAVVTGSGFVVLISPAMGRLLRLHPDAKVSLGELAEVKEAAAVMRGIPLMFRKRVNHSWELREAFER